MNSVMENKLRYIRWFIVEFSRGTEAVYSGDERCLQELCWNGRLPSVRFPIERFSCERIPQMSEFPIRRFQTSDR
uniref:Uncharacterized protein n=1 Tax=Romanomermis culicivorax TaxID=13658 RepID=A0A915IIK3_ROMCU